MSVHFSPKSLYLLLKQTNPVGDAHAQSREDKTSYRQKLADELYVIVRMTIYVKQVGCQSNTNSGKTKKDAW